MNTGAGVGRLFISAFALPLALAAVPAVAATQIPGVRTVSLQRGATGVDTLHAHVSFGGGRLRIEPAAAGVLYAAELRYDAESSRPLARFDSARGLLEIGTQMGPIARGLGWRRTRGARRDETASSLHLTLGRDTPTSLAVNATAAQATLELGGIALHELRIATSGAEGRVSFANANPARIALLELSARASSLRVDGLANAGVQRITARATAGQVELDLRGAWAGDELTVDANAMFGEVVLTLPPDVGVRVQARERLWGSVTGVPTAPDGEYRSSNWESATRRLVLTGAVTFGTIRITSAR